MENGNTEEDIKIPEEDIFEEYNGVYGGKLHIVSPEGFDLLEGHDYLKNSWEGSWEDYQLHGKERIHRYVAKIKVSNVCLAEATEQLHHVLKKFWAHETDLEIKNCRGDTTKSKYNYLEWLMYYSKNFSIHGCQLTFKELASIIWRIFRKDGSYDLSGNIFISKDPIMFTEIKRWINKILEAETSFKILDLRGCNFSIQEKEDLIQEATSLNLLI